jgi:hypothetical protein
MKMTVKYFFLRYFKFLPSKLEGLALYCYFAVLEIKSRGSHMMGKLSTSSWYFKLISSVNDEFILPLITFFGGKMGSFYVARLALNSWVQVSLLSTETTGVCHYVQLPTCCNENFPTE